VLVRRAADLDCPLGWFALDFDLPALARHRERGGPTCGVRDGHLLLHQVGDTHDLGAVAAMPLTLQGIATYNIANIAGAALVASALGIDPATIAAALARFGEAHADNPGRLQHWQFGELAVFVDYAHNPDGLRGLLEVATTGRSGRLALVLGQAGNREDEDIRDLVRTAYGFAPALVVLKDIGGDYLRGRTPGEIAGIMRQTLLDGGMAADSIVTCLDEAEAARIPLAWARDGDTVVLPIHEPEAREQVVVLLERMIAERWMPGRALP
jgi:UDP-N-acetylmuramyl tripeptide synthase